MSNSRSGQGSLDSVCTRTLASWRGSDGRRKSNTQVTASRLQHVGQACAALHSVSWLCCFLQLRSLFSCSRQGAGHAAGFPIRRRLQNRDDNAVEAADLPDGFCALHSRQDRGVTGHTLASASMSHRDRHPTQDLARRHCGLGGDFFGITMSAPCLIQQLGLLWPGWLPLGRRVAVCKSICAGRTIASRSRRRSRKID